MITISIPDDTPMQALTQALNGIGLQASARHGGLLRFEHIPGNALTAAKCAVGGCTADAFILLDGIPYCSDCALLLFRSERDA